MASGRTQELVTLDDLRRAESLLLNAVSDPVRLEILRQLSTVAELGVGDLVQSLDRPHYFVSRHLACLRNCHLVDTRKEGKFVYYRLRNARWVHSLLFLLEGHSQQYQEQILSCHVISE